MGVRREWQVIDLEPEPVVVVHLHPPGRRRRPYRLGLPYWLTRSTVARDDARMPKAHDEPEPGTPPPMPGPPDQPDQPAPDTGPATNDAAEAELQRRGQ